jgi:hypothetical protein
MRRDVRAIFIDQEDRPARRQSAPKRHGEIVQRDDQRDQRGDEEEAAGAGFHQDRSEAKGIWRVSREGRPLIRLRHLLPSRGEKAT